MKIIFCLSYLSVPHTITLVKKDINADFRIITSNKQLYKFFCELFDNENLLFIPSFSYTIPFSKGIILLPIKLIWIWRMKYKTWQMFKGYNQQKVYFFFNAAAFSQAWLLYKLSKKNVLFYQEDIDLSVFPLKKGIKAWFNSLFIKYIYHEEVKAINQGKKLVSYMMKDSFIKKINARSLDINLDYKSISNYVSNLLDIPEGDILMLTNLMPEHEITVDNHIKSSDEIIEQLLNNDYTVHFKMHSRAKNKYSLEKTLFEVPKYLPASLLLINYKVFIGYVTSALVEAANNDVLAISLIDFIPSNHEVKKQDMKAYLQSNLKKNKKIFFPATIEQLITILKQKI